MVKLISQITEEDYEKMPLSEKLEYIYSKHGFTKDEARAFSYFADLEDEARELERTIEALRQELEMHRVAILLLLDHVDYTAGNCRVNEMVGAVLPKEIIVKARQALRELEE